MAAARVVATTILSYIFFCYLISLFVNNVAYINIIFNVEKIRLTYK